jgi:hypothetical protein
MIKKAEERFNEVLNCVIETAKAKGWTVKLASKDDKKWKYASVAVNRWTTGSTVNAVLDITIDNGVKVAVQNESPFNPSTGLKDLHQSIMDDIVQLPWLAQPKESKVDITIIEKVENILKKFQRVSMQIQHRHNNRETLKISDEYDVQDLLHALLWIEFDDIRPEEYSPSYAGGASRIDFLIKKEKILLEVKMTNKNLQDKQVGEQLIIDVERYKKHPDCETLICFVYDPGSFLKNPVGLITDLSRQQENLRVKVVVVPDH